MRIFRPIFIAGFFFSFHLALVTYINSSALGRVFGPQGVSAIYMVGSALSLVLIFIAPRIIRRFGNVRYMATVLGISALLLLFLSSAGSPWAIGPLFVLYFSLNTLIYCGFDIFLERFSKSDHIGNIRGLYMGINNLAWVISPTLSGIIKQKVGFNAIYIVGAIALIIALVVLYFYERRFPDTNYAPTTFKSIARALRRNPDVARVIITDALLQLFYVWMIIYAPLYLTTTLGIPWETVGVIFSVMLLPFLLFQYPVGKIVDRFSNEREIIFGGFLVMGVSTLLFSFIGAVGPLAIALVLFLTRIGASVAEVSMESYFFKHIKDRDIELIGVFRDVIPLSYIVGPALALLIVTKHSYQTIFFALGIIMLATALFSLLLHDTRRLKKD
ncbi:MAG TPA: MFS transporter [Candidatus Paceibacterota bacterium]|jgi:MFS family permease|nr:MFS transporter [Candidatus Paceibacterota bacterium]